MAKQKTTTKTYRKLTPLWRRSKLLRFVTPVIVVAMVSLAGIYWLQSTHAAGNFVLRADTAIGSCPTSSLRVQYQVDGRYDYGGPQPEAPYRVEWRLTGDSGVTSITPDYNTDSGTSGTIMGSPNGDLSWTPTAFKVFNVMVHFANPNAGGTVTMSAVAYGSSGRVLARTTTNRHWPTYPADSTACSPRSPDPGVDPAPRGSGDGPGDGDGNGGTGTGTNGDGDGDGPGRGNDPGPGQGPSPSPTGGSGGGGGSTAQRQADKPNPLPKSVNRGTTTKQPKLEPSPFFDGKQYKRGSEADNYTIGTILSNTGSTIAKGLPFAIGAIAIAGTGFAVYWRVWRRH